MKNNTYAINMTALDKEGKLIDKDRKLFRAPNLAVALENALDYANWNLGWLSHSIIVEEEK